MAEVEGQGGAPAGGEGAGGGQAPSGEPASGGTPPATPPAAPASGQPPGGGQAGGEGGGQGGQPPRPPETVPASQFREIQGQATRVSQENAILRSRIQSLEAAGKGNAGVQPKSGVQIPENLKEVLGNDAANALASVIQNVAGATGNATEQLQKQLEVSNFYSTFPDMREHQQEIEALEFQLNDQHSPLQPIHVMGLAVRGMHMADIVQKARADERAKVETELKQKAQAGVGPGTGITPSDGATDPEVRSAEAKSIFGVEKPTYSIPK